MRFLHFQLNDFRMSDIIWTVGPGEEMKAERIVTLDIRGHRHIHQGKIPTSDKALKQQHKTRWNGRKWHKDG